MLAAERIDSGLRFITRVWVSGSSRKMEYDLRNDVYAHIQSLDQKFFQDNQTGDLMARVSNDVTTIREILGPGLMDLFRSILLFIAGLAIMLTINVPLTLLTLIPLPLLTFLMLRFGILATLVWHYTVDALYTSLLLFRSGNTYYVASAAACTFVFAIPLLLSAALYIRRGGFINGKIHQRDSRQDHRRGERHGRPPAHRETLEGERRPDLVPAQLIQPENGTLLWLVDSDAARLLRSAIPTGKDMRTRKNCI